MSGPRHIREGIAEVIGDIACRQCGARDDELAVAMGPHPGGHHARVDCRRCGTFVRWLPKPGNERSRRGSAELRDRYSKGYCEVCRRGVEEIPLPGVLEPHHVIEVQEGGGDERENVWIVCTSCHRLIHHQRTYFGHYSKLARERMEKS
jgi:hypothetical protein